MTYDQRKQAFIDAVVTKNLVENQQRSFAANFRALQLIRRSVEFIISTLLVFGGLQLLLQNGFYSPLWPATGVGLSALFLRGYFILGGIFVGSLLSYLYNNFDFLHSLGQSILFTLTLFAIRFLSLRYIGPVAPLSKLSVLLKFIYLIVLICALHVFFVLLIGLEKLPTLIEWYSAWLGEINGILCLTPLALVFDPFVPQRYFSKLQWRWWSMALILITLQGLYFVLPPIPSFGFSLFILMALRFYALHRGVVPTTFTLLGISVIYLGGAIAPFELFIQTKTYWHATVLLTLFTASIIMSLIISIQARET